ncbi:TetR/AcrR family transcriptional regulator [Mesorhizobium sp. ORM16]|uniref:TetR/AcrR family transcriptional regulator n=1 Tax=Mesorhizobium sp. ORM16 TaxID=3376989 RepID=UPI003857F0CD
MYGFRRGTPMTTPKQAARRERIEEAAYAVLRETGYKSASLLAIAKRASASNETLYNWYGNKQTLFRSLIEANAERQGSCWRTPFTRRAIRSKP